jgi:hypothetical protein
VGVWREERWRPDVAGAVVGGEPATLVSLGGMNVCASGWDGLPPNRGVAPANAVLNLAVTPPSPSSSSPSPSIPPKGVTTPSPLNRGCGVGNFILGLEVELITSMRNERLLVWGVIGSSSSSSSSSPISSPTSSPSPLYSPSASKAGTGNGNPTLALVLTLARGGLAGVGVNASDGAGDENAGEWDRVGRLFLLLGLMFWSFVVVVLGCGGASEPSSPSEEVNVGSREDCSCSCS